MKEQRRKEGGPCEGKTRKGRMEVGYNPHRGRKGKNKEVKDEQMKEIEQR